MQIDPHRFLFGGEAGLSILSTNHPSRLSSFSFLLFLSLLRQSWTCSCKDLNYVSVRSVCLSCASHIHSPPCLSASCPLIRTVQFSASHVAQEFESSTRPAIFIYRTILFVKFVYQASSTKTCTSSIYQRLFCLSHRSCLSNSLTTSISGLAFCVSRLSNNPVLAFASSWSESLLLCLKT